MLSEGADTQHRHRIVPAQFSTQSVTCINVSFDDFIRRAILQFRPGLSFDFPHEVAESKNFSPIANLG
jgi:hypothetical protein